MYSIKVEFINRILTRELIFKKDTICEVMGKNFGEAATKRYTSDTAGAKLLVCCKCPS